MTPYPKIETLWERDEKFKVVPGNYRLEEFRLVDSWLVTEKVDGTNVRLGFRYGAVAAPDARSVGFAGKTDRASFSNEAADFLIGLVRGADWDGAFAESIARVDDPADELQGLDVVVYGELYGPKGQSGGWYRPDLAFRAFDVVVNGWWLAWANVVDVARKLGVETVPLIEPDLSTEAAVLYVYDPSRVAAAENPAADGRAHEGIVARTDPYLFTRKGDRVIWKLKVRDFA